MLLQELTKANTGYVASGEEVACVCPLLKLSLSPYGSKILSYILNPSIKLLEPDEQQYFMMPSIHSKKTESAVLRDHVIFLKIPLDQALDEASNFEQLSQNGSSADLLFHVIVKFRSNGLLRKLLSLISERSDKPQCLQIENLSTYRLVKRILQLEVIDESNTEKNEKALDLSLHDDDDDQCISSFALHLLRTIHETGQLDLWLNGKRSRSILALVSNTPSAQKLSAHLSLSKLVPPVPLRSPG